MSDRLSFWRSLFGPNKTELALSKQRQELIERAEHAEAIAFEALAEKTEIIQERDALQIKVKELEQKINQLKSK